MLYVGSVLEKRLDVNAIIDNVVTSDLIRTAYSGLRYTIAIIGGKDLFHCVACTGRAE